MLWMSVTNVQATYRDSSSVSCVILQLRLGHAAEHARMMSCFGFLKMCLGLSFSHQCLCLFPLILPYVLLLSSLVYDLKMMPKEKKTKIIKNTKHPELTRATAAPCGFSHYRWNEESLRPNQSLAS